MACQAAPFGQPVTLEPPIRGNMATTMHGARPLQKAIIVGAHTVYAMVQTPHSPSTATIQVMAKMATPMPSPHLRSPMMLLQPF